MKTVKSILSISIGLALVILAAACDSPFSRMAGDSGDVIIRIAGADGRTIMPANPVFSGFELTLQKDGGEITNVEDTSGITGAGVTVSLNAGTWVITLKAYREIDDEEILAATGTAQIDVRPEEALQIVPIELKPLAINAGSKPGVFSYAIILPDDLDTAFLSLCDTNGDPVNGYNSRDLLDAENLSGSITLPAGYYDLSVLLSKNGQNAGVVEAVHIYPGLESRFDSDLSVVEFADKVYITGTLNGVRLGTLIITDEDGTEIARLELNEVKSGGKAVERSANWIIDIPSMYIGKPVKAVQQFNNESATMPIAGLPINGVTGLALNLSPDTPERVNIVPWYASVEVSEGDDPAQAADGEFDTWWNAHGFTEKAELVLDFGFDVDVNSSQIIFYSPTGDETGLDEYTLEYWDGLVWVNIVKREQAFKGSADASLKYGDFFPQVRASLFRWTAISESGGGSAALVQLGLFKALNRDPLSEAIDADSVNLSVTPESEDGAEIYIKKKWVTKAAKDEYQVAIDTAKAVCEDPAKSADEIADALLELEAARNAFNNSKLLGNDGNITMEDFTVQDGYADKFVIHWNRYEDEEYALFMRESEGEDWGAPIQMFYKTGDEETPSPYSYTVDGITPGITRYFAMQPFFYAEGDRNEGVIEASPPRMTLGVPQVSLNGGPSYSTISVSWTAAQKADAYRIVYHYTSDPDHSEQIELGANVLAHSFNPVGYNDIAKSGSEIQIIVEALNKGLHEMVGGSPIFTSSDNVNTNLVGPARLDTTASQAASTNNIAVSWNKVEGAGGYYVFRQQYNIDNSAPEGTYTYYVSAAVTGPTPLTDYADASFEDSRFTLNDRWFREYPGGGSAYEDQQDEIAWGKPYHYFVAPVLNEGASVAYNGNTYTVQDISFANAVSYERTGFTIGFGIVTASKGGFKDGNNDVSDKILITWSMPPMLSSIGYNPSYAFFRKEWNSGINWAEPCDEAWHIDGSVTGGEAYEYFISIDGSEPFYSPRFMEWCRTFVDAKGRPYNQGYLLDMVKVDFVSKYQVNEEPDNYGEHVRWFKTSVNSHVAGDPFYGIDGYMVYVMNRNIDGEWHEIMDVPADGSVGYDLSPDFDSEMLAFIPREKGNTYWSSSLIQGGLLKVLRDYKHYFKVRSYVIDDYGVRHYCPDPTVASETNTNPWTYRYWEGGQKDGYMINQDTRSAETGNYVKWGARQITAEEFIVITTLYMAKGVDIAFGTGWNANNNNNASGNYGATGKSQSRYNASISYSFNFQALKPDLNTRAGGGNSDGWQTFITINGWTWAEIAAVGQAARRWGDDTWIDVSGPGDTPGLYTGSIRMGSRDKANSNDDLLWGSGYVYVNYPTADMNAKHPRDNNGRFCAKISWRGQDTPLTYTSASNRNRFNTEDAWK